MKPPYTITGNSMTGEWQIFDGNNDQVTDFSFLPSGIVAPNQKLNHYQARRIMTILNDIKWIGTLQGLHVKKEK